ncbi:putative RNA methyltransferase [Haliea sp. E17]|uniref:putative RNA methyltransferase n=1 Tax=Haliea sp. E17 TaxID=3401576 RepID=UPI003AB0FE87
MNVQPFLHLACPLDDSPLTCTGSAWVCASGHNFDIAARGYTHLLPVQHKRTRDPGDSKAMVAARQRFLAAGFYQRIADAVNRALLPDGPVAEQLSCLDAGCGEGYYLRELVAAYPQQAFALLGVDISKWAVQSAAKRDARPNWVVGSNAHLPVQSASIDRLLCLFGFPVYPEFARVLKPGGLIVQVDAGSEHLQEVRQIIYPRAKPARQPHNAPPEGFSLAAVERVTYPANLYGADIISDLLEMTPHFFRASAEGRAALSELDSIRVTVDVQVASYSRSG